MTSELDILDAAIISSGLGALAARYHVEIVESCFSTNTLLMERVEAQQKQANVIVTDCQTAGRGRRGRAWLSAPGASLTFSVLWELPQRDMPLSGLSLAIGLAVATALEKIGAQGICLKWPNDILVSARKMGGILVDVMQKESVVVMGMGLNVNLPAALRQGIPIEVTDLATVLGRSLSRNFLLAEVLKQLDETVQQFQRDGFSVLQAAWNKRDAFADQAVQVVGEQGIILIGQCAGVDVDGALLIDTDTGRQRIISGEVSLRQR